MSCHIEAFCRPGKDISIRVRFEDVVGSPLLTYLTKAVICSWCPITVRSLSSEFNGYHPHASKACTASLFGRENREDSRYTVSYRKDGIITCHVPDRSKTLANGGSFFRGFCLQVGVCYLGVRLFRYLARVCVLEFMTRALCGGYVLKVYLPESGSSSSN